MTKKGESRLQRRIQDKLKAEFHGSFFFKTHGSIFQMAGLPDLVGCVSGMFFGLEVKDPDRPQSEPSILQMEIMKRIQDAGGYAGVIESPEQAVEIIRLAQQASISGSRPLPLRVWLSDSVRPKNRKDPNNVTAIRSIRTHRHASHRQKD